LAGMYSALPLRADNRPPRVPTRLRTRPTLVDPLVMPRTIFCPYLSGHARRPPELVSVELRRPLPRPRTLASLPTYFSLSSVPQFSLAPQNRPGPSPISSPLSFFLGFAPSSAVDGAMSRA
jgi:hypothetical protein